MTILQIDDDTAQALEAQARALGLRLEEYVRVIAGVEPAADRESAQSVADFDAALNELFAADTRPLSADSPTYSREDIYHDHD
jgi:hypothetical protein